MEVTPLRGIPYPSEYDDPFFSTYEDMMNYLDVNVDMRYTPVDGIIATGAERLSFTPSDEMDQIGGVGYPIRYRVADLDNWRYGIIDRWNPAGGTGEIKGAALDPGDVQFQIGSPAMVRTVRMFFAGNYNSASYPGQDGLFWTEKGEGFRWEGPRAYLVKIAVVNKVSNGQSAEYIQAQRNSWQGGGGSYASPVWEDIFEDNSGWGPNVQNDTFIDSDFADVDTYHFYPGDIIDVHPRGSSPNSAEDLSVEMTFVYRGFQDQTCIGQAPATTLTISGMTGGKNWQGLTDGVHSVCPVMHRHRSTVNPQVSTTRTERWVALGSFVGYSGDDIDFNVGFSETGQGTSGHSSVAFKFYNGVSQFSSVVTASTSIYGYILDRLFTTFVMDGVTFTLSRGPGDWAYVAPPPPQQ